MVPSYQKVLNVGWECKIADKRPVSSPIDDHSTFSLLTNTHIEVVQCVYCCISERCWSRIFKDVHGERFFEKLLFIILWSAEITVWGPVCTCICERVYPCNLLEPFSLSLQQLVHIMYSGVCVCVCVCQWRCVIVILGDYVKHCFSGNAT